LSVPPETSRKPRALKASAKAFELALKSDKIYLGVFYDVERPTFEERIRATVDAAETAGIPRLDEIFLEFT
jgi:hypothetical protein